jgi:hypothetical protein
MTLGRKYYSCSNNTCSRPIPYFWDLVRTVRLPLEPNKFAWKWSANGQCSSTSAFSALFVYHVNILGARHVWKIQMSDKCRYVAWLVLHYHCWTSDRLHYRGLMDLDTCALCEQELKTLDCLLVDCVYS